jgi:hypothetical protein
VLSVFIFYYLLFFFLFSTSPMRPEPRVRTFAFLEPISTKDAAKLSADRLECRRRSTLRLDPAYGTPGSVVIASSVFYRAEGGEQRRTYQYHLAETEQDVVLLVTRVVRPAVPCFYYIINSLDPVQLYMDFDAPQHVFASDAAFRSAVFLAVHYLRRFLDVLYCGGCDALPPEGWVFFSASTTKKWSMHVHAALCFETVLVLKNVMLAFIALMRTALCHLDQRVGALFYDTLDFRGRLVSKSVLDDKVYTARPFRLPLCSKHPDAFNPLLPLDPAMSHADCVQHGFVHKVAAVPLAAPVKVAYAGDTDPAAELSRLAARFSLAVDPSDFVCLTRVSSSVLSNQVLRRNLVLCALRVLVRRCRASQRIAPARADAVIAASAAQEFAEQTRFADRLGSVVMDDCEVVDTCTAASAGCMADYAELEAFAAFALTTLDTTGDVHTLCPADALARVVSAPEQRSAVLHEHFLRVRASLNASCALTVDQVGMLDGLLSL